MFLDRIVRKAVRCLVAMMLIVAFAWLVSKVASVY
jgi:hypothetical protein